MLPGFQASGTYVEGWGFSVLTLIALRVRARSLGVWIKGIFGDTDPLNTVSSGRVISGVKNGLL